MRGWMMGWGLGLVVIAGAGGALACSHCDPYNTCVSNGGAVYCIANSLSCLQIGRCGLHMISDTDGAIAVTLLDDAGIPGAPARVEPVVGGVAVGRAAGRVAARALGGANGRIVYSGSGYFGDGTVAFRTPQGDGFTLRRQSDGRGARLTVRELSGGRPGRTLAHERIGDREALVVRVPFGGRTCALVLTAATLPAGEAATRQAAERRELAASADALPASLEPPFTLEPIDP